VSIASKIDPRAFSASFSIVNETSFPGYNGGVRSWSFASSTDDNRKLRISGAIPRLRHTPEWGLRRRHFLSLPKELINELPEVYFERIHACFSCSSYFLPLRKLNTLYPY
jgi:hypothetical protein